MRPAEAKNKYGRLSGRLVAIILAALLVSAALPAAFASPAFAASVDSEKSVREVHKVGVGNKVYCFFVTHNVVMTPAEIASFGSDDEKLTDEILKRAGLYMKEQNCKLATHKAIEPAAWKKTGGTMTLGSEEEDEDILETLRTAVPTDGHPVRVQADLHITTETPKEGSDEKPTEYTTFKKSSPNSPRLIYIAVATEADAALGEEICEEEKSDSETTTSDSSSSTTTTQKQKKSKVVAPKVSGGDEEEVLPEERTISMTDRSGDPLEPTLKDGDPVTLEWKEPGKQTDAEAKTGFFDHAWAIPATIATVLAIGLAAVLLIRRRKEEE